MGKKSPWGSLSFTELLEALTKQPFSSGEGFLMACAAADMGAAITKIHADLRAENAELWRSCRTIPMTPSPEHCYDPVLLILSGEKRHTVRGNPRRVGSFQEVTVKGRRTGIILRITQVERIADDRLCSDEFAWADGFRPPEEDGRSPAECLRAFAWEFMPQAIWADPPPGRNAGDFCDRWLLHFEVYRRPEAKP